MSRQVHPVRAAPTEKLRTDQLGEVLGTGRDETYAYGPGQILKVFHRSRTPEAVEREARNTLLVRGVGQAAPQVKPKPLVVEDGRLALLYEDVEGDFVSSICARRPLATVPLMRRMAKLHRAIHAAPAPDGLPRQREHLSAKIRGVAALSLRQRQAALAVLQQLPDGESTCHGNYHPGEMLATRGGDIAIGWRNATIGNPWCDVARTLLILGYSHKPMPLLLSPVAGIYRAIRARTYLRAYLTSGVEGRDQLQGWLRVNAAVRLAERLPELQQRRLIRIVDSPNRA